MSRGRYCDPHLPLILDKRETRYYLNDNNPFIPRGHYNLKGCKKHQSKPVYWFKIGYFILFSSTDGENPVSEYYNSHEGGRREKGMMVYLGSISSGHTNYCFREPEHRVVDDPFLRLRDLLLLDWWSDLLVESNKILS